MTIERNENGMTIKELREFLAPFPDDGEVWITDYQTGLTNVCVELATLGVEDILLSPRERQKDESDEKPMNDRTCDNCGALLDTGMSWREQQRPNFCPVCNTRKGVEAKRFVARGVIECDKPNSNQRTYPEAVIKKALEEYQSQIDNDRAVGMFVEDYSGRTQLTSVSHSVKKAELVGGRVDVELEILDTPKGRQALAMMEYPSGVQVSPIGYGSVTVQDDGTEVANKDYKLLGFGLSVDFPELAALEALEDESS